MPGIGSQPVPKPAKGSYLLARRKTRTARRTAEDKVKDAVRLRDGYRCRFPDCREQAHGVRLEVAHLEDKGMGGDKRLIRTQRDRMICLCFLHHQGPVSVHSKDVRIEYETARGTDGPCAFYVSDEQKRWKFVGIN